MRFRHELSYAASPAEVFEMLADQGFRERVCQALDVVSAEVSLTRSGAGFTLSIDQVQRTEGLPSFAKKIVGDTTRIVHSEEWADPSGGSLEITTPGKPTHVSGRISLAPDGAGTTEVVELELKAKVPLIGGKLEGLMAEQVRDGMAVEHEVATAWLAEARK